jgi:hypothetical protein
MYFCRPCLSDPALDVGKIGPDFYAAEVGSFGADRSGDSSSEIAGRADVLSEFGEHLPDLFHLFD